MKRTFSNNEGFFPTAMFNPEIGVLTLNLNGNEFDFIVEDYCGNEPEDTDTWLGFAWKNGEYDLNLHNCTEDGSFALTIQEYFSETNTHGDFEEVELKVI